MIKVFVNNKPVFVPKNTSALEACESIEIAVPRFCYHERLNVAGNCRMCLVEIEKVPKPVASCAFPVAPNMRIYTDTPLVHKARENVLEFLLINHPLDCPICDQGGECDLQEQTMVFGSDRSRFFYAKRGVEDKNCGPLVKTIMTRCIHCTRCVRFFQDIAGQEDFGTTLRGTETEIGTYIGKNLDSELSGNIIDLCPVGALTSKPYAFTARPWEIKAVETVDIHDSVGSNIKINFKETEILRVLPALNDSLNEEWISDKTRFSFDGLKIKRIGSLFISNSSKKNATVFKDIVFSPKNWKKSLKKTIWRDALNYFSRELKNIPSNKILFVCGNTVDLETLHILKSISQILNILLISETFLNSNNNLMGSVKSNTVFNDILDADLCLTIGTNTRFEASLLNVRLRKRIQRGGFTKASIGLCENLTYKNLSIGNSLKTLIDIAEGKHFFCQKLIKAKTPFLIIGSSLKKRLDAKSVSFLVNNLSKHINICNEEWFGLNFLPLTANETGKKFIGINTKNKLNLSNKKFIYCVGLDSYDSIYSNKFFKTPFIVAQTPYSDSFLQKTDLVLPSTAFTEKEGTFLNMEGRAQKTSMALTGPNLSRDDSKIIKALFNDNLKEYQPLKPINSKTFLNFSEAKNTFTKTLVLKKKKTFVKVFKTPIKSVLSNFFLSNAITKNSLTMAKCASLFKKNYTNFI
jgi:NADH-quinone oxidoreductase chain G